MRFRKTAMIARPARIVGCLLALSGILATGGLRSGNVRADDIKREQIEQLQKAREDARATRDSLEKSLKQAEEKARTLGKLITKLKGDLETTKSSLNVTEQELTKHADAVRKFNEECAQSLVKAAGEAKRGATRPRPSSKRRTTKFTPNKTRSCT